MNHRADIDGLRALAVLPVLLGHARIEGFSGGFVGVDVFFVISGYLITSILVREGSEGRFSFVAFYERRARRIFPALFAMLAVICALAWWNLYPKPFAAFGRSAIATTLFASNLLFWRETGYFDVVAERRPLLHTWSLAVEEQFYVFFPVAVWLTLRHLRGRFALWVPPAAAASFALSVWGVTAYPTATFYLAPTRAWELLLGSMLALEMAPPLRSQILREGAGLLGLACIAVSIATLSASTPFPGPNAVLPCAGAALIIHAGGAGRSLVGRVLALRPMVFVGSISYSLYLWHWPLLVFVRKVSREPLSSLEVAGVLAAAGVLATLSWRFVEQPFRKSTATGGRGRVFSRSSIFSASAAATTATLVFGVGVAAPGGIPSRFAGVAALETGPAIDEVESVPDCDPLAPDVEALRSRCSFGSAEPRATFVVWGDSHADAWQPFFARHARANDLRGILLSIPGCPPLVGAFRLDDHSELNRCRVGVTDRVAERVARLGPDTVYLVSRWSLYNHGWIQKGALQERTHFVSDPETTSTTAEESQRVFARGLARTVEALTSQGIDVVFVKTVPVLADVPAELYWSERSGERVETKLEQHLEWQAPVARVIDRLAALPLVSVLDPTSALCTDARCRYRDDAGFFYRDDNHLSLYGAMVVHARIQDELGRHP